MHLNEELSVNINCIDQGLSGLSIAGPKSREVLQSLVDENISNESFKFMDIRKMDVSGAPCIVNRITFTGDLGFEIWMEPSYQRLVYNSIKLSGQKDGIVDFGVRALLSMRLEKNFPTWGRELRPIYGPFECNLDRFIKLDKNIFIGSDAVRLEKENGPKLRRVSFIIETNDADVMGDEPIWAQIPEGEYTSAITKSGGQGSRRFNEKGVDIPNKDGGNSIDGEWSVVGWITSGGFGHYVELSLAQGYIPNSLLSIADKTNFEIEILGQRCPASITLEPPFDPSGKIMRG